MAKAGPMSSLSLTSLLLLSLVVCSQAVITKTLFGTLLDAYPTNLTARDQWSGIKHVVVSRYGVMTSDNSWYDWVFGEMLTNWNNGRITHFTWSPCDSQCGMPGPDTALQVVQGVFDSSISNFTSRLSTFIAGSDGKLNTTDDRRLFIRLGHEMNGNWYPWSQNSTHYVQMWQYVWAKLRRTFTPTQVQFVWEPVTPLPDDAAHQPLLFYPGDSYVDWFSLDGYNWARVHNYGQAWYDPWEVYDSMIYTLRDINPRKPLMVSEVGCATVGASVALKNKWIANWYQYAVSQNIQIVVYFDTTQDGADWNVFGGTVGTNQVTPPVDGYTRWVYNGYATSAASYSYTLSSPSSPRLLTDAEFFGQLPGYNTRPATPPALIVFDDVLKYDWVLANAGSNYAVVSSPTVNGSAASIQVTMTAWGSLMLQNNQYAFNTTHYSSIQFAVNVGNLTNLPMQLKFFDINFADIGPAVRIDTYFKTGLPANQWVQFNLPWSLWNANIPKSGVLAKGYYLQCATSTVPGNGHIFLDNIKLTPNDVNWY